MRGTLHLAMEGTPHAYRKPNPTHSTHGGRGGYSSARSEKHHNLVEFNVGQGYKGSAYGTRVTDLSILPGTIIHLLSVPVTRSRATGLTQTVHLFIEFFSGSLLTRIRVR